ncbi:MAG TPA: hypothetical protein VJC03_04990, partial [bacterium]|nr:hypothetical protein [bacterium]
FSIAESQVEVVLKIYPASEEALALKEKLARVKELRIEVRNRLLADLQRRAQDLFEYGNYLECLSTAHRAMEIDPSYQEANKLFQTAYAEVRKIVKSREDIKELERGMDYYLNGNFAAAVRIFRRMQPFIPEIERLLSQTILRLSDQTNMKRSEKYFRIALRAGKKGRHKTAKVNLFLSLELDKDNLQARQMMAEVNLELGE